MPPILVKQTIPHQLHGTLGFLGAKDEGEVLESVLKLFTSGKLASDEGKGPQLPQPGESIRAEAGSSNLVLWFSCQGPLL